MRRSALYQESIKRFSFITGCRMSGGGHHAWTINGLCLFTRLTHWLDSTRSVLPGPRNSAGLIYLQRPQASTSLRSYAVDTSMIFTRECANGSALCINRALLDSLNS